jgi:hypothetical protein
MASPSPSPAPSSSKEKTKTRKQTKETKDYEDTSYDLGQYMLFLFPISIFSALVAWWKNSNSNIILRIIYVILAYLLNVFYLIYSTYRWWTYRPPAPVAA